MSTVLKKKEIHNNFMKEINCLELIETSIPYQRDESLMTVGIGVTGNE